MTDKSGVDGENGVPALEEGVEEVGEDEVVWVVLIEEGKDVEYGMEKRGEVEHRCSWSIRECGRNDREGEGERRRETWGSGRSGLGSGFVSENKRKVKKE